MQQKGMIEQIMSTKAKIVNLEKDLSKNPKKETVMKLRLMREHFTRLINQYPTK
ncbi:MAG: hypothetical protein KDD94_11005 [Calditrichaeota bacterium]|nr:hypothetical protein [Calditrichota bacterium]